MLDIAFIIQDVGLSVFPCSAIITLDRNPLFQIDQAVIPQSYNPSCLAVGSPLITGYESNETVSETQSLKISSLCPTVRKQLCFPPW